MIYGHVNFRIGSIVLNRQAKFWMQSDFIFKLTDDYRKHEECLRILHGFSYRVIRERKETISRELHKSKLDSNNNQKLSIDENGNNVDSVALDEEESLGKKKRLAFLDLLITASGNGTVLTDEDIREEVDTFVSLKIKSIADATYRSNFRCLKVTTQPQQPSLGVCFCLVAIQPSRNELSKKSTVSWEVTENGHRL